MAPKKTNDNMDNSQQQANKNKKTGGGSQRIGGDGPRANPVSISKRAGVVFPIHRIRRDLKSGHYGKILGLGSSVYLAGVLEYLVAEVVELAGNAARDNKKKRITPRHLFLAIRKDEELNQLLENVTIASGGVLPNIHQVLLPANYSSQSMHGEEPIQKKKKTSSSSKKQNKKSTADDDSTVNSANTNESVNNTDEETTTD